MVKKNNYSVKDGGYGVVGNMCMYLRLSDLSEDLKEDYELSLKKENPKQYKEYKEWERLLFG